MFWSCYWVQTIKTETMRVPPAETGKAQNNWDKLMRRTAHPELNLRVRQNITEHPPRLAYRVLVFQKSVRARQLNRALSAAAFWEKTK